MVNLSDYQRRFKSFWNEFKQSKRGIAGIIIILFFAVIAIMAPVLSPLDPMYPGWQGYYPGATAQPQVADKLCVPIWYKSLPGGEDLSENIKVVPDHEFSSKEVFEDEWDVPQNVLYDSTMGTHNGSVKILYEPEEITTNLTKKFEYPFNNLPQSYWLHISAFVEIEGMGEGVQLEEPIPIRLSVHNETGFEFDIVTFECLYANTWRSSAWSSRNYWIMKYFQTLGTIPVRVFSSPGNYTFNIGVTVNKNQTGGNEPTVYVDDAQLLIYGEAFGLLGTDAEFDHPRDLFTMLIYGTRISFMIGVLCAVLSVLIGLFVGLATGYLRGIIDEALMRFADLLMVLPTLPLMIVLVIVIGSSIWNIVGILIFMGWMGFSRSVRSMVLSLRERQFVEAAKAAGAGKFYIIQKHILPNVFALVYISLATSVPGAIIAEASLAWLGLGDASIPSWGNMFYNYSRAGIAVTRGWQTWFWVLPPGIAITLLAISFILIGFALDEILNPKLRQRR